MDSFTRTELALLRQFKRPADVQAYLDGLAYRSEDGYFSPRSVIRDGKAHCADGALFACTALRRLGHPPLLLNLYTNGRDDEHLLALYQVEGRWGAVSKSNYTGLRYREPVYKTLRELAISYFESYFNLEREKTLRGYRGPLHLSRFDPLNWMTSEEHLDFIIDHTDHRRAIELFPKRHERHLTPVDERTFKAGLVGANRRGLRLP